MLPENQDVADNQDQQQDLPIDQQPTPPEPTPAEPSTKDIVADIKQTMDKLAADRTPGNVPLTPAQFREAIKEKTGYTDEQVDFHFNSMAEAMAPIKEELAWSRLEKKFKDMDSLRPDMEEELKAYPAAMRGDPVLMEKIYFMSKGKKMTNQPPTPQNQQPKQQPNNGNVVSRRLAPEYPGFNSGSDTSNGGGRQVQLSNEQREFARRMGQKEEDYIEHMDRKPVREFLSK